MNLLVDVVVKSLERKDVCQFTWKMSSYILTTVDVFL